VSPLFGGFASTGAIARTATNIRNGANSPLAGVVHSLTLIAIILVLAPLASYIPLAALAAILFVVAYNMSEIHRLVHMVRTAPRPDVGVLLVTFGLTVFADLVVAVNVGVVLASLLFMRRMAQAVEVQEEGSSDGSDENAAAGGPLPAGTAVYSIDGPFFFGAAEKLERTLENIQSHADTVVLRLGRVPFVDASGIHALEELVDECNRFKTRLVFCELRPNVRAKLARAGLIKKIGSDNIFPLLRDFVRQQNAGLESTAVLA
jgi:SulP family sulfate permease